MDGHFKHPYSRANLNVCLAENFSWRYKNMVISRKTRSRIHLMFKKSVIDSVSKTYINYIITLSTDALSSLKV